MLKHVLVTGGSQRLGALLCRQFAQAGWQVWCHYQRSADLAQALCAELCQLGVQARPIQADLADAEARRRLMDTILAETGPLHALVNNASSFEPDSAAAMDEVGARGQLEVNLLAPLALAGLMAQSLANTPPAGEPFGRRSVIHVLDQKVFNLNPDYFSYTLSKLGLERAVRLQAQSLAPQIRVNAVAPGLMYLSGPQTQANFDMAAQVNLLRRPIDPKDVAQAAVFLAQTASITGTCIQVDNGQHLVPLARDVLFVVDDMLSSQP